MAIQFAPARREARKGRIALDGPSGSGKTYSALRIAAGLGDRIAVIDTERHSAALYADQFAFDHGPMDSYEPDALIEALATAADAGYDVVVVDSLSHFWSGTGGMLEQVDKFAARSRQDGGGRGNFTGWKDAAPLERRLLDALLSYPGHVIVTLRVKTEYVVDERGKPTKVGLRPEQRQGLEYEFDIVADLDLQHNMLISKTRWAAVDSEVINRPGPEFGVEFRAWLESGVARPTVADYITRARDPQATVEQLRELHAEVKARGMLGASVMDNGLPVSLGGLIARRGEALAAGTQRPAPAAKPTHEPPAPTAEGDEASQLDEPSAPPQDDDDPFAILLALDLGAGEKTVLQRIVALARKNGLDYERLLTVAKEAGVDLVTDGITLTDLSTAYNAVRRAGRADVRT